MIQTIHKSKGLRLCSKKAVEKALRPITHVKLCWNWQTSKAASTSYRKTRSEERIVENLVPTIISTTTICHYHHLNHHHLSLSSSQPPPSVTIIITTTTISHYHHHNHHQLFLQRMLPLFCWKSNICQFTAKCNIWYSFWPNRIFCDLNRMCGILLRTDVGASKPRLRGW